MNSSEISNVTYCASKGSYRADIKVARPDGETWLLCTASLSEGAPTEIVRQGLLQDAVRQMQYMPEIRSGRDTLIVK
ncbi:hypothetical protein [Chachezhania sediminis]|uniref:hypothetical protein n=1 Tax=Chachezhania sediminis TaxID=2599291 RepID=UPI001E547D7E|nr:hypothetical protein [Chachezhania sediminis]